MIKLKDILKEGNVKGLSFQQALDNKLFGPVYHGTSESARSEIEKGDRI